jgi:hypothetical protein
MELVHRVRTSRTHIRVAIQRFSENLIVSLFFHPFFSPCAFQADVFSPCAFQADRTVFEKEI